MKIPKQPYTTEFKELAVTRVREGQSAGAVAKELGLIEQTLRNWVKAASVRISESDEQERSTPLSLTSMRSTSRCRGDRYQARS